MDKNFENIQKFDIDRFNELKNILGDFYTYGLMTETQKQFINGIIRKFKPKKILEIGGNSGAGSVNILNAIRDIDDSKLYSVDISQCWDIDYSKPVGFAVTEKAPNLTDKWKLYTGNVAAKFLDEIGNNIDLVILDAAHNNPGEILDFITILPYLSKEAIIVIHDIQLHNSYTQYDTTCGSLFSCLKGKKFYPYDDEYYDSLFGFPNIGAVILDPDISNYIEDIFFLLTMPWKYIYNKEDNMYIVNNLNKHYSNHFVKIYDKIRGFNLVKINHNDGNKKMESVNNNMLYTIEKIDNKLKLLINTIAWWIPIKKWRDNFRSKFAITDQTRPDQTRPDQK